MKLFHFIGIFLGSIFFTQAIKNSFMREEAGSMALGIMVSAGIISIFSNIFSKD